MRKSVVSNIDIFMCILYDALINNVYKQTHGGKDSYTLSIALTKLPSNNAIRGSDMYKKCIKPRYVPII